MELNELFRAIHMGVRKANILFSEWTGGEWLQDYGVEGFAVAHIAGAVMNPKNINRPGFLTLETPFSVLYESSKKPIGRKGDLGSDSNRIDIALYHKNETLSHVIEVKRYWCTACYRDLDRLCNLYKKCGRVAGGPLKQAIFVLLVEVSIKKGAEDIEEYFKKRIKDCRKYIDDLGFTCIASKGTDYYRPLSDEESLRAFSSLCLSICN